MPYSFLKASRQRDEIPQIKVSKPLTQCSLNFPYHSIAGMSALFLLNLYSTCLERRIIDWRELLTIMQTRAAEDILSLIRELKQAWFDGQLQTIGTSQSEKEAEKHAVDLAERLKGLAAKEGK